MSCGSSNKAEETSIVSSEQTQVLRFYYYYEYYNKSRPTAVSINELFPNQSQISVTYLQILFSVYFICPSVFHKTINTLYYAKTGVIPRTKS